ncbi:type I-E CRISPR-associated protein Cas7/Cse4/CasC [Pseudomarimonas arenosa]|uniref:Type I-E CRISPR-associated protein Cas7/Cse4/CasC n=1 Tax=Pseudomarimonas arenosa TaxID=2774145 RepID=A0AAW3ZIR8_9GAMM|nr:type I-E CRISPR-associated protein Cas7/Cse4/CasC [Pseudomarimonas arenosa]MBD8525978.1 type I-E CRISPR-associated protein Cas7/Cse4/CasC [Pseudomarimonas arenosa]
MSAFLEYHLIQNFAPSNLNRDDTGAPKDAIFGGHRRARQSSQCQKKAIRDRFKSSGLVSAADLGVRTRHLDRVLFDELKAAGLDEPAKFNEIVKQALKSKDKKDEDSGGDKEEKSAPVLSYLLFVSATEVDAMKALVTKHANKLKELAEKKKIKRSDVSADFKDELKDILGRSKAVDVALFGRMLADLPAVNQDAACQVAHAISTHRVEREFDYFTAVDDKGDAGETGAGMIGQVEFNSATLYRYAVLDLHKLRSNLNDRDLTLAAVEAFTRALALAIPSGKQNSFAAHNPPEFIGVCLRHATPLSLANAFEKPVLPRSDLALTEQSVERLAAYEAKLAGVYAAPEDQWLTLDLTGRWPADKGEATSNLDALAQRTRALAAAALEG